MSSRNKVIFLLGRDNWQKDDALNHVLINHLREMNHQIIWEDPAGKLLYQFKKIENKITWLPEFVKRFNLRFIQVLYGITHWSYFSYLSQRKNINVEFRTARLKKRILQLNPHLDVIILSRSANGRYSSLIADNLHIKQIICLSYPFQNPEEGVNPARYSHLKDLKTPMLIFQGEKDEYGGLEVLSKYELSPAVELFFVNTDHEFLLSKQDWERVLNKLTDVIGY